MKSCYFYKSENECRILTKKECEGCRFYMTEADYKAKKAKAEKRLNKLPKAIKNLIKEKYYGKTP